MRGGAPLCNFYPVEEIGFHFLFVMAHDIRLQGLPSAPKPHRADQCPVKFQREREKIAQTSGAYGSQHAN